MADVFSPQERSQVMRKIKSRANRSTELRLIRFFQTNKISGWRRNYKLFGKPDFVFPKFRASVFVDGCFWHGHDCRNTKPATNAAYWKQKIARNKQRDQEVNLVLKEKGWRVIRIWECELKNSEWLLSLFLSLKLTLNPSR